jgi:hypothetical protein
MIRPTSVICYVNPSRRKMIMSYEKQISLSDIQPGPIRHPVLPDGFIERVRAFKATLGDVDAASLDQTIDNFKRDAHPESELVIWERIASMFAAYLSRNPTTDRSIRKEVYSVLLGASAGVDELEDMKHLSEQQIKQIIRDYRGLPGST